jgi:hypothetical protein
MTLYYAGDSGSAVVEALREVGTCHQQLNNHTAALQAYSEALNRTTSDVSTTAHINVLFTTLLLAVCTAMTLYH